MGAGREAGGNFAVIAKKEQGCLHAPRGNWGGKPVRYLMLESRHKRGRKG